jgi:hypothetical protein
MLSRSGVVKLKAILIIDLMIVGAAAGVYFYLQNQGVLTSAAKPATFTLTDLIVNPLEAYAGDAVQISVNLTNIGDLEGNQTVNFEINNTIKATTNVTLAANSTEVVEFTYIETIEGNYTVKVGDLTSALIIKPALPESSKILLSNLISTPYEVWANENVTITASAVNPSGQLDKLTVKIMMDDVVVGTQVIALDAGASQIVQFTINASSAAEGKHIVKLNTLKGSFVVVKTGYHTLIINRSGGGSTPLPFTLNGENHKTAYQAVLPVGEYTISVPDPFSVGTGVLAFTYWSDGLKTASRSFTLNERLILVVTYTLISGYASCPSLYIWNGTGYSYVTDVSNPGWLGYISHINSDGTIIFGGGNPWDYVKLDKNILATNNGNYDVTLAQQWDELYYLDSAYIMVVDHPIGTDVYTSMTNYLNKGSTGQIYTVINGTLASPTNATNEQGQNVLSQILQKDGVYTPGINGDQSTSWNNITMNQLTLDLGNLSAASQIKLLMTGMVDWGSAEPYYAWINSFKVAAAQGLVPNGTQIMPPPYMEVKDSNGNWIRVSQDRQIPIPSDYNARTFTVDLTGLFPSEINDFQVRFTNFWNVTYDYIGIDTSLQQNITIQKLAPSSAVLSQMWETQSNASGAFTRYGDVTPLMQNADDMYVIGRQGDQVNMQFSTADLSPLGQGMERDYFFVVACWFKDPLGNWGYGYNFTVNPMPFIDMSGFPYPNTESYPYDAAHLAYIQEYNTRVITTP